MVASREERGRALRGRVPRSSIAQWKPPRRRDAMGVLVNQERTLIKSLLPLRHQRMSASPFAFYRGSAAVMAADLADVPVTGLRVQVCGDAHVANFGIYGTPERNVVFDLNDFDETILGPWEWDVVRMAASLVLAARDRNFSNATSSESVYGGVQAYRTAMLEFAAESPLAVWYERIDLEKAILAAPSEEPGLRRRFSKAKKRTAEHLLPKLTGGSQPHFVDSPPAFRRIDLDSGTAEEARRLLKLYGRSLAPHVRRLFERFHLHDVATKAVGIGSVGTLCMIALLLSEGGAPLLLQLKEAQASVLERYAGKSTYRNHGERVVQGQRLMQAASDIFLGWFRCRSGHDFYVRQLRDMKYSFPVDGYKALQLERYAEVCGWTLARAHAKSGDAATIAGYLGGGDNFESALGKFALAYADQTEQDHAALAEAARSGRVDAVDDEETSAVESRAKSEQMQP